MYTRFLDATLDERALLAIPTALATPCIVSDPHRKTTLAVWPSQPGCPWIYITSDRIESSSLDWVKQVVTILSQVDTPHAGEWKGVSGSPEGPWAHVGC